MKEIDKKIASTVANIVEQRWLTRYPWLPVITYNRGTEFMAEFAKMIKEEYEIERKPISSRNPQANAVLERIHQTIGNMIKSFQIFNREDIDEEDPWSGILAATMFGVRATFHTTLQASPCQLVFGRDAILPIKHRAEWKLIKDRKQKLININNKRENAKRIPHTYRVGDKVLLQRGKRSKHGDREYNGPFPILEVRNNGTLKVQKNRYTDTVNIRQVIQYHE